MVGKLSKYAGFGTSIIIKPKYEKNIIYLLAHLNKPLVKEEEDIEPEQEVAEVGNDGTKDPHLHISVIETNIEKKDGIVSGTPELYSFIIDRKYVDPFNHKTDRKNEIPRG